MDVARRNLARPISPLHGGLFYGRDANFNWESINSSKFFRDEFQKKVKKLKKNRNTKVR